MNRCQSIRVAIIIIIILNASHHLFLLLEVFLEPLQGRRRGEGEVEAAVPFSLLLLRLPRQDPREVGSLKVGGASYEPVADWDRPHDSV
jgi:hypothetical protein